MLTGTDPQDGTSGADQHSGQADQYIGVEVTEVVETGATAIGRIPSDEQLTAAAREHSEDMLSRGYYSHHKAEGIEPAERKWDTGYAYSLMAENIHMKSASYGKQSAGEMEEDFTDWMESQGHRENLLNPALREVGIGVATGQHGSELGRTSLYTVDFGTPQ